MCNNRQTGIKDTENWPLPQCVLCGIRNVENNKKRKQNCYNYIYTDESGCFWCLPRRKYTPLTKLGGCLHFMNLYQLAAWCYARFLCTRVWIKTTSYGTADRIPVVISLAKHASYRGLLSLLPSGTQWYSLSLSHSFYPTLSHSHPLFWASGNERSIEGGLLTPAH